MSSVAVARVERDAELALIVVRNPPVNTIDAGVRAGVGAAVQEIAADVTVRGVLLLCEERTFFSGADIAEFSGPPREEEYRQLFNAIEAMPVPGRGCLCTARCSAGALRLRWPVTIAWPTPLPALGCRR